MTDKPRPSYIQQWGQVLLFAIFATLILMDLSLTAYKVYVEGWDSMGSSIIRLFLTLGLMKLVWTGCNWARWLMIILLYVCSILLVIFILKKPHFLLIGMMLVSVSSGSLIAFHGGIKSFLRYQNAK